MTIIPSRLSPTALLIDAWYEREKEPRRLDRLRCSSLGEACDRKLWYALRWCADPERHDGRILRIFENGHLREKVIIDAIRGAGLTVDDVDPATGEQWRVSFADGRLTGSADGIVTGVPEAPKTRHLLEIKTMNDARWNVWRKKGVKDSDPKYWVQMQLYMAGLGLTRALLVCENQNTREIDCERVEFAPEAAAVLVARAERITEALDPPERAYSGPDFYQCRQCGFSGLCWKGEAAQRNCRTCANFSPTRGRCGRHGHDLDLAAQEAGCDFHLMIPPLVDGEPVEFVESAGHIDAVHYRMRDGSTWVDGMREGEIAE